MGKLVCEILVSGELTLASITTAVGAAPALVKGKPGVGKPFWYWPTLPPGKVIGADFTNAPIATNSTSTNQALIDAITVSPEDVLIFEPPEP